MKLKKLLSVCLALALLAGLLPAPALALVPDDEYVGEQWALEAIRAYEAWDLMPEDAQPVTVAVLDGGFDLTHEDLAPNLYRDAAGNVVQFNTCDGLDTLFSGDHATHVAGIIAAVAGNGTGVAGVLPCRHGRAVPAGNVILFLRLGVVHGVIHDVPHGLIIDLTPFRVRCFLLVLRISEHMIETAFNRPYLGRRHTVSPVK